MARDLEACVMEMEEVGFCRNSENLCDVAPRQESMDRHAKGHLLDIEEGEGSLQQQSADPLPAPVPTFVKKKMVAISMVALNVILGLTFGRQAMPNIQWNQQALATADFTMEMSSNDTGSEAAPILQMSSLRPLQIFDDDCRRYQDLEIESVSLRRTTKWYALFIIHRLVVLEARGKGGHIKFKTELNPGGRMMFLPTYEENHISCKQCDETDRTCDMGKEYKVTGGHTLRKISSLAEDFLGKHRHYSVFGIQENSLQHQHVSYWGNLTVSEMFNSVAAAKKLLSSANCQDWASHVLKSLTGSSQQWTDTWFITWYDTAFVFLLMWVMSCMCEICACFHNVPCVVFKGCDGCIVGCAQCFMTPCTAMSEAFQSCGSFIASACGGCQECMLSQCEMCGSCIKFFCFPCEKVCEFFGDCMNSICWPCKACSEQVAQCLNNLICRPCKACSEQVAQCLNNLICRPCKAILSCIKACCKAIQDCATKFVCRPCRFLFDRCGECLKVICFPFKLCCERAQGVCNACCMKMCCPCRFIYAKVLHPVSAFLDSHLVAPLRQCCLSIAQYVFTPCCHCLEKSLAYVLAGICILVVYVVLAVAFFVPAALFLVLGLLGCICTCIFMMGEGAGIAFLGPSLGWY